MRQPDERALLLAEDQLVGQLATVALYLYMGHPVRNYLTARDRQNKTPHVGDGGSDIPPATTDVKASRLRSALPLIKHRLAVRPRERHAGNCYILAICDFKNTLTRCRIHFVGWATDEMLPPTPERDGPFEGAHVIRAAQLMPLPPFGFVAGARAPVTGEHAGENQNQYQFAPLF